MVAVAFGKGIYEAHERKFLQLTAILLYDHHAIVNRCVRGFAHKCVQNIKSVDKILGSVLKQNLGDHIPQSIWDHHIRHQMSFAQ